MAKGKSGYKSDKAEDMKRTVAQQRADIRADKKILASKMKKGGKK